MAAVPVENFSNLNPQSNREWLMHINEKLDALIVSHNEDREDFETIINNWDDWKKCHDKELSANLQRLSKIDEKVEQIEKKVNTWSLTNTLAAIGAFITAIFMKGS